MSAEAALPRFGVFAVLYDTAPSAPSPLVQFMSCRPEEVAAYNAILTPTQRVVCVVYDPVTRRPVFVEANDLVAELDQAEQAYRENQVRDHLKTDSASLPQA